jgi:hypothetical protein
MDPNDQQPAIDPTKMAAPGGDAAKETDPLVNTWFSRVKAGQKHWDKLHQRMRHNRKLVRGIDDSVDAKEAKYNQQRANLIGATLTVVLSKVYAKNPEMSAEPLNKARDLRLFADTVGTVTQTMLEDAGLKKKAKAMVRAAMTCSFGIVKVQYQRVTQGDSTPIIRDRIADTQDNIQRLQALIAKNEDQQACADAESQKRELEETLAGLQSQSEVVAAEGLVIDKVSSDRLVIDPAIEDFWEYETAGWMAEKIPMRKSEAMGKFPGFDLSTATTYKVGEDQRDPSARRGMYNPATSATGDDAMIVVWEIWSRWDNRIYTLVEGCNKQFAVPPYTPKIGGERWWPYFILPFQSVDGEFAAQSLVDLLERLQQEHNETRDKFAEVRRNIRPHKIASGDLKDKDIKVMVHPEVGEIVVVNTNGAPLNTMMQEGVQLQVRPEVYDTGPIRYDWEQVSGLQDAARSTVVQPKTATEAAISDQALSARVAEFRDQIEDTLTEIAQYSSELCLLAMTPAQVETIMGSPDQLNPIQAATVIMQGETPDAPEPTYEWPGAGMPPASPETVFNLVQIKIRAGSTAAPNKLEAQDNWNKALQLLMPMIDKIRQLEMQGMDATPERELVKETAARFDETVDVERFLPMKPLPKPALPAPGLPGLPAPGGMPPPGATLSGGGAPTPSADPAAAMPHMVHPGAPGAPLQ